MNDATVLYGKTESEAAAEENLVARQIVREITNFGVSQRQMMLIVYLLAMELENVEHMRALTKVVRDLGGDGMFIIGNPEPDHEIDGGASGT